MSKESVLEEMGNRGQSGQGHIHLIYIFSMKKKVSYEDIKKLQSK